MPITLDNSLNKSFAEFTINDKLTKLSHVSSVIRELNKLCENEANSRINSEYLSNKSVLDIGNGCVLVFEEYIA